MPKFLQCLDPAASPFPITVFLPAHAIQSVRLLQQCDLDAEGGKRFGEFWIMPHDQGAGYEVNTMEWVEGDDGVLIQAPVKYWCDVEEFMDFCT